MSALPMAIDSNGAFPSQHWDSHTARVVTHWGRSGLVITVTGEVDAANASDLADDVQRCAALCEWLVLDFSDLEFIGTAGLSMLHAINTRCADHDVHWALVPGAATARLLHICSPDAALPTTGSVDDALAQVQGAGLRLIAAPQ